MRSKAHIKGHPIHPMLIPFPIAFLSAAIVCDAIGWLRGSVEWSRFGAYAALAGIGSALVAAIPGMVDYLFAVPPDSSGKKRATYHMIVNLSAVTLFVIAWVIRRRADTVSTASIVLLELLGGGLMSVGGWLGGTLVYRNMVGVDHRHTSKGKWKEKTFKTEKRPIAVADTDELKEGQTELLRVGDKRVVLARTEKGYVAFDDHCTHRGASLADGVLICGRVQCLWHGSQFDVHTGQVVFGPAEQPLGRYQVEEKDGKVWLYA